MNYAKRFAKAAKCKVILSLRPLSYANAGQVADSIIDYVEHRGPDLDSLMRKRFARHLTDLDDDQLARKFRQTFEEDEPSRRVRKVLTSHGRYIVQYRDFMIPFSWIRQWFSQVCDALFTPLDIAQKETGAPDAHGVVNGASGFSLRAGKILTEKVCASHALPIAATLGLSKEPWTRRGGRHFDNSPSLHKGQPIPEAAPHKSRSLRDSEVLVAMLVNKHEVFRDSESRIFLNLFSCGRLEAHDLTCKVRMLHWVKWAAQRNISTTVGALYQWLGGFDYDDDAIVGGLNELISDYKRLLWTDSVARFDGSLTSYASVRLALAPIGEFYLSYLLYNSDYIQAMQPSSAIGQLLKMARTDVPDRLRSLRLFLEALVAADCSEVRTALANYRASEYVAVYGPSLFSPDVVKTVTKGVMHIFSDSALSHLSGERREKAEAERANWKHWTEPKMAEDTLELLDYLDRV